MRRSHDHLCRQVVPLKQLGSASGQKAAAAHGRTEEDTEPEPKPDLAVIECFGKAVAIMRKVHPDRPVEMQRQIVQGEYLNYDRRSGEFYVPGEGLVYLYDRPKKSAEEEGPDSKGNGNPGADNRGRKPADGYPNLGPNAEA